MSLQNFGRPTSPRVAIANLGRDNHSESGPLLGSTEVCELAGITYRQLDHWARKGYITATSGSKGSGVARQWTRAQADAITELAEMMSEIEETWKYITSGLAFADLVKS